MAAGCPAKCAKFLLIIFNIIFWLSGAALLAIGIWLAVDPNILKYFDIFTDGDKWFKYAAYVMIAVGAFAFLTGFLGCCGAIKESPCMLGTYIFLLVIVMLVEVAVGVLAFIFRSKIEGLIVEEVSENLLKDAYMETTLTEANLIKYTGYGVAMNFVQQELKCCGVNGSIDYDASPPQSFGAGTGNVPLSCCTLMEGADEQSPQIDDITVGTCENPFTKGCKDELKDWLEKNTLILIGLGIGIACLEIFGIIFAVCVCRNPSEKYD